MVGWPFPTSTLSAEGVPTNVRTQSPRLPEPVSGQYGQSAERTGTAPERWRGSTPPVSQHLPYVKCTPPPRGDATAQDNRTTQVFGGSPTKDNLTTIPLL
eukprot:gene23757-biopygen14897